MKTLSAGAFKGGRVDSTSKSYRVLQVSLHQNFPVQRRANFTLPGRLKKVHHFLLARNKNNNKCSDKLARHLNFISRQLPGVAALSLGQKHRNDERDGDDDIRAATESLVRPPLPAVCQREPDTLTGPGKLTVSVTEPTLLRYNLSISPQGTRMAEHIS